MNLGKLVKETQVEVDKLVPGVTITVATDPDNGQKILTGTYMSPKWGLSTWTERIDRYFTNSDLFLHYFKQRSKYMNASVEDQLAFEGHPATF
jgi:hypothetical protein|tara:strand:- start:2031 stop:2309 length:279 start_codon:yes stop_codon:yes gene_type:complete